MVYCWLLLILYILNQILHTMGASLSAKRTEQICTEQVLCVWFLWFRTVHFLYVCGVSSNSDPLTWTLALGEKSLLLEAHRLGEMNEHTIYMQNDRTNCVKILWISVKHLQWKKKSAIITIAKRTGLLVASFDFFHTTKFFFSFCFKFSFLSICKIMQQTLTKFVASFWIFMYLLWIYS